MSKNLVFNDRTDMFFGDNLEKVTTGFKDYMNHYYTEVEGKKGLMYDTSVSFEEKDKKMNRLILNEISKATGFSADHIKNKAFMASNPNVTWATFAIISQLIESIFPDAINREIGRWTETRYVGWGDSALFEVENNDFLYVSKAGRAQRTIEFQRAWRSQLSVVPEPRMLTIVVSMYAVLCGKESMARLTALAVRSFEAQLTTEVFTAFDTAFADLPNTTAGSQLSIAGWDEEDAIRLAQVVTAWNGGRRAAFMGTTLALRQMLPSDANYRYELDSPRADSYMRLGHVRDYMGYDVIELPQIANPSDPYNTALRDDVIYVFAPTGKPVKLVYEGTTLARTLPYEMAADLEETTTLQKSYGIGIAAGSIAGIINLQ